MKYLKLHYDTFYFRRKLQYQTFCISLRTKNILEAKYILSTINAKLEILREIMDISEEVEYIKNLLKKYVSVAKEEYTEFSTKREQKYIYTKENGKKLLGSHPKAIEYHMAELQDSVYSANKEEVAQDIINDSNIKEEYEEVFKKLSIEGRERLLDEVIKAEIELLDFDKRRNEVRTTPEKIQNTYITEEIVKQYLGEDYKSFNTQVNLTDSPKIKEETKTYKVKTKEELFEEYLEEVKEEKKNMLDKVIPPIKTLLQSSDSKYLSDYKISNYEVFFESLIYTPKAINKFSRIYKDYEGNYVQIAEDFKESLLGEENLLGIYIPTEKLEKKLQGEKNVEGKLTEVINFLKFCEKNDYIKKNYLKDNIKFSSKKFKGVLKGKKQRKPFNENEINLMFSKFEKRLDINKLKQEQILIPLLAIYGGMRIEEICKLRIEDIRQDTKTGIWYFDINGLVKTDNSVRKVPIHSQLIDKFKILEYVETRKANKKDMLFDLKSVYHKGKEKFSHYFLRDFFSSFRNSFVSQERIEEDLLSFHSFRHTFATRLRAGRVDLFAISNLLGHAVDTVSQVFFNAKIKENETPNYTQEDLEILKEDIENLQLADIQDSIDSFSTKYREIF